MARFRHGQRLRPSSEHNAQLTLEAAIEDYLSSHRRRGSSPRYLEELHSYLVGCERRERQFPLLPWAYKNGRERVYHGKGPYVSAGVPA